jgi:hypothetical protein
VAEVDAGVAGDVDDVATGGARKHPPELRTREDVVGLAARYRPGVPAAAERSAVDRCEVFVETNPNIDSRVARGDAAGRRTPRDRRAGEDEHFPSTRRPLPIIPVLRRVVRITLPS